MNADAAFFTSMADISIYSLYIISRVLSLNRGWFSFNPVFAAGPLDKKNPEGIYLK
jgi:hypothetical protein